jgi:hypothetical protein
MLISCWVNLRPIIRSMCWMNSWRDSSKFVSAKSFCSVPVCFLSVIKLRLRHGDDISRSYLAKTSTLDVKRNYLLFAGHRLLRSVWERSNRRLRKDQHNLSRASMLWLCGSIHCILHFLLSRPRTCTRGSCERPPTFPATANTKGGLTSVVQSLPF